MKKIFYLLFALACMGCQKSENQIIKTVNFEELEAIINEPTPTLQVVNFWATWCLPCVEELPGFMEVNKQYQADPNFKMLLVSLDKAAALETKVIPFVQKKGIVTDVYLLDDNKRMNHWIPAIDANWSGAIPATVLYKNGKKVAFVEGQLTQEELNNLIKSNL